MEGVIDEGDSIAIKICFTFVPDGVVHPPCICDCDPYFTGYAPEQSEMRRQVLVDANWNEMNEIKH
jgi:hypothetical protein